MSEPGFPHSGPAPRLGALSRVSRGQARRPGPLTQQPAVCPSAALPPPAGAPSSRFCLPPTLSTPASVPPGPCSVARGCRQPPSRGIHRGPGACERRAPRLSPRLLSGGCICPEASSGSHEHCPVGCSCAHAGCRVALGGGGGSAVRVPLWRPGGRLGIPPPLPQGIPTARRPGPWPAEAVRVWCVGSHIPPNLPALEREPPGAPLGALLPVRRQETVGQEGPTLLSAQAVLQEVSGLVALSAQQEGSVAGMGTGAPECPTGLNPTLPAACSTWAVNITASLLTSRAPSPPTASSPQTRRPSMRRCCGAAGPS